MLFRSRYCVFGELTTGGRRPVSSTPRPAVSVSTSDCWRAGHSSCFKSRQTSDSSRTGLVPRSSASSRLTRSGPRPLTLSPSASYKQQKFNLLREESEGYAKLIVELQSNMGPAHSTATARSIEADATRMQRAKDVNDKVKTLIGTSLLATSGARR